MEVTVSSLDRCALILCKGALDENARHPLMDTVQPLVTEGAKILIDISDVERINSEGIAAMVQLVNEAKEQGCQVVYAAPGKFVSEVLHVTRLENYFEVAATRDEGLELLGVADISSA